MTRAFLTAAIAMLSLGAAHAETAKPRPGNVPGIDPSKKVCYYEASGFTYHYVIELGLVPQWNLAFWVAGLVSVLGVFAFFSLVMPA